MKKNLKTLLGLGMALSLALTATAVSFADSYLTASGTISADDLKMTLVMPSTATLAIKPYSAKQIQAVGPADDNGGATKLYFANPALPTGEDEGVQYNIGISGYTVVGTSKTTTNKMALVKDITQLPAASATSKSFDLGIYVGAAVDTSAAGDAESFDDATVQTALAAAPIDITDDDTVTLKVQAATLSTADYGKSNTKFTAPASTDKAKDDNFVLVPGEAAEIAILGNLNTKATWEAGDKISVVPIFSISPSGYDSTQQATT